MIGRLTASMNDKGTKSMSRQAIQDKLDAIKARVSVFGGQSSVTFQCRNHQSKPKPSS